MENTVLVLQGKAIMFNNFQVNLINNILNKIKFQAEIIINAGELRKTLHVLYNVKYNIRSQGAKKMNNSHFCICYFL